MVRRTTTIVVYLVLVGNSTNRTGIVLVPAAGTILCQYIIPFTNNLLPMIPARVVYIIYPWVPDTFCTVNVPCS